MTLPLTIILWIVVAFMGAGLLMLLSAMIITIYDRFRERMDAFSERRLQDRIKIVHAFADCINHRTGMKIGGHTILSKFIEQAGGEVRITEADLDMIGTHGVVVIESEPQSGDVVFRLRPISGKKYKIGFDPAKL